MSEIQEFFHMGGYARFVWGSYGVTVVVLLVNWILPRRRARRLHAELAAGRD